MKNPKKILGLILVVFLITGLTLSLYSSGQKQEIRPKAAEPTPPSYGSVFLDINSPGGKTFGTGQILPMVISILNYAPTPTGPYQLGGVNLEISYNPSYLTVQSVANSGSFPTLLKSDTTTTPGKIYFAALAPPGSYPNTYNISVATVTFLTKNMTTGTSVTVTAREIVGNNPGSAIKILQAAPVTITYIITPTLAPYTPTPTYTPAVTYTPPTPIPTSTPTPALYRSPTPSVRIMPTNTPLPVNKGSCICKGNKISNNCTYPYKPICMSPNFCDCKL